MADRAVLVYEDLEKFPDDNFRREILRGELSVSPTPERRHQQVVGEIFAQLRDYARRTGGKAYVAPLAVVLSAQNVLEPDVIFVAVDRLDTLGKKAILGVPSLVIEVLSPSTQGVDRVEKRTVYAHFGVPEYWIADPEGNTIERCSEPAGKQYRTIETFDRDMPAATLTGFVLSFDEVFGARD